MSEGFRCPVAGVAEPLAGTAAVDHAFLLVEYAGPWGRRALEESRLPERVRTELTDRAARAGVRVTFAADSGSHTVVESVTGATVRQSCGDLKVKQSVHHRVR